MITWILSGMSVIGAVFCAFKSPKAWYIWLVADIGWVIFTFFKHEYAQMIMWIVYAGICVAGIYQEKKEKNNVARRSF